MHRIGLIARYEFLSNIRKRSFLVASIGMPIFTVIIFVIIALVAVDSETNVDRFAKVGMVDQSGVIANLAILDGTLADGERPIEFIAFADANSARAALDASDIGAYFVLEADYYTTGRVVLVSSSGSPEALTDRLNLLLIRNLSTGIDPTLLERILDPTTRSVRDLSTGRLLPPEGIIFLVLTPIIFAAIFMIAGTTTSGYLMSGVVEEKTNRIMEILITAVTPMQLLAGKILGLGLLGLFQLVIWAVLGVVGGVLSQSLSSDVLSGFYIAPDLLALMIIYFLLGYFTLATVMAGIGAVVGSEQESRQFSGIVTLLFVVPFIAFVTFIIDPNGVVPTVLSIIPLTSPTSMIMRASFTIVPPEQLLLSLALLVAFNLLVLWVSARIFRLTLLLVGNPLSARQLLGLFRPRPVHSVLTAPTGEGSATT